VLRHRQGRPERLREPVADNSPDEWKYVEKGTCTKLGGKSADEAKKTAKK
jgi:uncharacterized membrane protein